MRPYIQTLTAQSIISLEKDRIHLISIYLNAKYILNVFFSVRSSDSLSERPIVNPLETQTESLPKNNKQNSTEKPQENPSETTEESPRPTQISSLNLTSTTSSNQQMITKNNSMQENSPIIYVNKNAKQLPSVLNGKLFL